jgi:hypothetical protein
MPLRRGQRAADSTDELDADIESRLVWIFGSPRTGSTWLLRMLIEPWKLARNATKIELPRGAKRPSGRGVVPINESHLPMHLTPFQSTRPLRRLEVQPPPSDLIRNTARAEDPSYFFADQYEDVWRPGMRKLALERFRAQAERVAREHRLHDPLVIIKEPNGSHGAEMTMSLLPRSRLIFLFRDGRDVLDSQLAMRGSDQRVDRNMAEIVNDSQRDHFVKGHARLWVNSMSAVQSAYEAHPQELRLRLRYETLREKPLETLRELSGWLGLGRSDEELQRAVEAQAFENVPTELRGVTHGHRAATPGLWRKNLTEEDLAVFEEIAGEKLRELGYVE